MPTSAFGPVRRLASLFVFSASLLALFGTASSAAAQILVKVNEEVHFRLGVLVQTQADFQEVLNATGTASGGYQENLIVRRVRLILGGQVARNVFFFFETDNPNLGKSTQAVGGGAGGKALGAGFNILDAAAEWRLAKEFNVQLGVIRSPISREGLKSTPTQFLLDQSAYNLPTSTVLQNNSERDTGTMFRGYLLGDRLEYRSAILSGLRAVGARNSLRFTERLQYDFFDTETYNLPSYPGSYLGSKKILAVGVGYDTQSDFRYGSADAYLDIPASFGSFESTIQWQYMDGGAFLGAALPEQNTFQMEAGVYLKDLHVAPIARYEQKTFTPTASAPRNENRVALGLNYYPFPKTPHALNFKCWWQRVSPKVGFTTNQFTVQMQVYYF